MLNRKQSVALLGEVLGLTLSLALLIWVLPNLEFVTAEYAQWMPIAVWATTLSSLLKIGKHLTNQPASIAFELLSLIPSLYSTYKLLQIFPLNFETVGLEFLNRFFPMVLGLALFALGLALIVNLVRLTTSFFHTSITADTKQ